MAWAAVLAVAVMASGAFAQDLPKIAVYVTGDFPNNEKEALGTRILASLVNSRRYRGIERSNSFLTEVEKEHTKQRSGAIDDGQIRELGKQFGVQFVCVANITPALGAFQVSARIIDVETAEVAFIGESYSALKTVIDLVQVSDQVVRNMFGGQTASVPNTKPDPAPEPEPPKTYTVSAAASPPDGGSVTRSPNYTVYYAGTRVTVTATPRAGYTFAGWSGGLESAGNSVTITVDDNLTLTANFQRIPVPEPDAPSPTVAAIQPKPEYKPYEQSGAPQKQKNRSSAGAGGFFANDIGGGLKWGDAGQIAMPYSGGGAYIYLDFIYTEFAVGLSGGGGKWKSADATDQNYLPGMSRTYMNFGAFVKYPFDAENIQFFPLLGIDYEASISAELNGNSGIRPPNGGDLSALWFKLGGGIDVGVSENAYLRAELMYGWRTANTYEDDSSENVAGYKAETRPGSGWTFKFGIGVKF